MFRLLTVFVAANGAALVSALRLHGGNKHRVHVANNLRDCQVFSRTGDSNGLPKLSSSTSRSSASSLPSTGRTMPGRTDIFNRCQKFSRTGEPNAFASTSSSVATTKSKGDSNRKCRVFSREGAEHNGMLASTARKTVPSAPSSRVAGSSRSGASFRGCKVFSRTGEPNGLPAVTERSGASTERDFGRVAGVFAREGQKGNADFGMQTDRNYAGSSTARSVTERPVFRRCAKFSGEGQKGNANLGMQTERFPLPVITDI